MIVVALLVVDVALVAVSVAVAAKLNKHTQEDIEKNLRRSIVA